MENIHRLIATIKEEPGYDGRLVCTEDNGKWECEVQMIDKQEEGDEWRVFGIECSPAFDTAGNLMDTMAALDAQCHTVLVAWEALNWRRLDAYKSMANYRDNI